jgi:hypothetical protein
MTPTERASRRRETAEVVAALQAVLGRAEVEAQVIGESLGRLRAERDGLRAQLAESEQLAARLVKAIRQAEPFATRDLIFGPLLMEWDGRMARRRARGAALASVAAQQVPIRRPAR